MIKIKKKNGALPLITLTFAMKESTEGVTIEASLLSSTIYHEVRDNSPDELREFVFASLDEAFHSMGTTLAKLTCEKLNSKSVDL